MPRNRRLRRRQFGEYVFQLVVGDDRYEGEPDQVLILVAANRPPVANAGADRVCGPPTRRPWTARIPATRTSWTG